MAIISALGSLAASDKGAPQMRRGGIVRLGRPGTLTLAMAVVAFILVACGGGSDDTSQKLPSVGTGSEVQMAKDLAPNFEFTLFQGEGKLAGGSEEPLTTVIAMAKNNQIREILVDGRKVTVYPRGTAPFTSRIGSETDLITLLVESGVEVGTPSGVKVTFKDPSEPEAEVNHLRQLQGKPVVLNFWAGLCPPCRAELPDLQEFYNEFGDRVTLIGIDIGQFTGLGSLQDAKDLLEELEITYPVGSTNDSSVIREYKVFGMPTTIFIDAEGEIFKNWGGALTSGILRQQTTAMLGQ